MWGPDLRSCNRNPSPTTKAPGVKDAGPGEDRDTGEFRWNAPGFADVPAFLGKRWGEILQFFVFIDHGGATLLEPQPGERGTRWLTGGGVGVQMGITDNFLFKLEWAKPVIRPIDGQPPSDGLDNYVYFLAVKWF